MSPASIRYARAFVEMAQDQQSLDAVAADFADLARLAEESSDFARLLGDPAWNEAEREAALRSLLADRVHSQTWTCLRFLVTKGRLALLPEICEHIAELVDEAAGLVHAVVVTARPFEGDQLQRLRKRLERRADRRVELKVEIDPSLLAGFRVRLGDEIIDQSIRGHLDVLQEKLVNA